MSYRQKLDSNVTWFQIIHEGKYIDGRIKITVPVSFTQRFVLEINDNRMLKELVLDGKGLIKSPKYMVGTASWVELVFLLCYVKSSLK
ncbi:MAG TPA: hypothetical protein DIS98_01460 [Colwellia sp.]|nr:hypothetical protein [Colwellia sp.]|tara:strand:+ start:7837 stop:8100 length:264 start_codon:yes stop_codon:yes gene_type:complete